ncbi:MAG: hypothetical protein ACI8PT_002012 [Gammaproteobacteria bacterium]|jgi:uncharacterized protein
MMSAIGTRLSDEELDQLEAFLGRFQAETAMNMETSDGFFTALHCAPVLVPPSVALPELWGGGEMSEDEAFDRENEHEQFLRLVLRHWNDAAIRLSDDDVFLPVLYDDDTPSPGNGWALGFMRGMEFHHERWSDLVDNDQEFAKLIGLFPLAHEHDPDRALPTYGEPMSSEQRERLLIQLSGAVASVYRYFAPQRADAVRMARQENTVRRTEPKIGRNDPCLCGSGKKYKKCCALL